MINVCFLILNKIIFKLREIFVLLLQVERYLEPRILVVCIFFNKLKAIFYLLEFFPS